MIALAIEKAGSEDSVAIRDALREIANPDGECRCRPAGFRPKHLISFGTGETSITLVASGDSWTLMPQWRCHRHR